jgi:Flp pilus assembly protein TadD
VQAEARWKKAVELNPHGADALTNHGQLLVEAGDYAGAAALLERAVQSAPGGAASWHDLGNAYDGLGRSDDARRARERAMSLDAGQASLTEGNR